jgi:hypothetical protein
LRAAFSMRVKSSEADDPADAVAPVVRLELLEAVLEIGGRERPAAHVFELEAQAERRLEHLVGGVDEALDLGALVGDLGGVVAGDVGAELLHGDRRRRAAVGRAVERARRLLLGDLPRERSAAPQRESYPAKQEQSPRQTRSRDFMAVPPSGSG